MSHVTTIHMQDHYDIQTLKQMCLDQGWEFIEGQTHYRWYGRYMGDYPLPEGFTKDEGLSDALGENGGLLKQAYGIAKTKLVCRQSGIAYRQAVSIPGRPGWQKITVDLSTGYANQASGKATANRWSSY